MTEDTLKRQIAAKKAELDRLRLGPISIKERTRTVGGVLTVESTRGMVRA